MSDTISIHNLSVHLPKGLGPSAFNLDPAPPCPALISLDIHLNPKVVPSCVGEDTFSGLGVNYSNTSKAIYALATGDTVWEKAEDFMIAIAKIPLGLGRENVESVVVRVELPRAVLTAQSVFYSASFDHDTIEGDGWRCGLKDVRVRCIVGLHPHERREKQWIECDAFVEGLREVGWGHKRLGDEVYEFLEDSTSGTLEALISSLADHLISYGFPSVELTIRKPSALPFATPSISIHRSQPSSSSTSQLATRRPLKQYAAVKSSPAFERQRGGVFIALGSNIGDRVQNLTAAVKALEDEGMRLIKSGRWYESEAMYVEDQARFLNTVIEVETSLNHLELLFVLKKVERQIGRTKTFRNGPRVVDLDLILYGKEVFKMGQEGDEEDSGGVGWLEVPHGRMGEREFVLRPLADIAPDFVHPIFKNTISQLLDRLPTSAPPALAAVIPFPSPINPLRSGSTPRIMQIFNATPDSFSDGSSDNLSIALAIQKLEAMFNMPYPPDILDIGGMSTRPNSQPCSEDEELNRVVPLIRAIRASDHETLKKIPISIDTYRPSVARQATEVGASMINDVRGGREEGMLETMAELGVPVVLMHSRGDSISMTSKKLQDYTPLGGVVAGVTSELSQTIAKALENGVRPWNIIIDPGLGFAKSHSENLVLLRHVSEFKQLGYPLLIGGSRKGFVGKVVGRDVPAERGFGDAGVVGWCAQEGVELVRVHDGMGMGETLRMVQAIREADSV